MEGMALGRALNFDQPAAVVHDHVEVGVGAGVFIVVQVEYRFAAQHADRDRRNMPVDRVALELAGVEQSVDGIDQGHVGAGDRGGAGTAVGLDDVAVQGDRELAEGFEIDHRAQGTADQALDFEGAPALATAAGLALVAGAGGARQHPVFCRHPALTLVPEPGRQAFFDAGGAQHAGFAKADQYRAFGVLREVALDGHRAELVGCATGRSVHHGLRSYFSGGKVTMAGYFQAE